MAKIKIKTKKIKKNLNFRQKPKKEKMENKGSENKLLVKKDKKVIEILENYTFTKSLINFFKKM